MPNDFSPYVSTSSTRRPDSGSTPRRLPAPPQQAKRISRPLPRIPRALACKKCSTSITSHNSLLPQSAMPPDSRSFRGFSGKAALFTETHNVALAKPGVQLMVTGAHTMQEITCSTCTAYVGWKIVRAHEGTESWKDGHFLLELENLFSQPDPTLPMDPPRRPSSGSGSDSDYST
ncbi:hypothetical protein GALMADRAFT_248617 [Galerina marginata CBS 339.88]|uniref:Yippee domain-containing protein n=1 Tax=Galerina marginata (strain CBS 339.88) TaxID=685588 RepID=A0A067TA64_GALM3|nr:hypothetical protein GALMADRAFT_248617 [Galerina marginata CBS 339.88]